VEGTCECGNEPTGSIKCGVCSRLAPNRLASQVGLCCMECVSNIFNNYVPDMGDRAALVRSNY
jgi:hypothetical protein